MNRLLKYMKAVHLMQIKVITWRFESFVNILSFFFFLSNNFWASFFNNNFYQAMLNFCCCAARFVFSVCKPMFEQNALFVD